jgi:hypothetical protein
MDIDKRLTISYVMNKMEAGMMDERAKAYIAAVYKAIEAL